MQKKQQKRDIRQVIGLVLCGLTLFGGTFFLANRTIDNLVLMDAEKTASGWAAYLATSLTDIETIASGGPVSTQSLEKIRSAAAIGQVFRFKLFDKTGKTRLISDELGKTGGDGANLSKHNPKASAVLASGRPFTVVKEGKAPSRPPLYAETYLPVMRDGKPVAIVEVYMDQTAKRDMFRSSFVLAAIGLAGITAFSFGIPAAGFFWRSRQKASADEQLVFLAHHDPMTHLMNRATFSKALDAKLRKLGRRKLLAVFYIDIDHFKEINDSLGHDLGDAMLLGAADRLRALCGDNDVISRFGGDEFVLAQEFDQDIASIHSFADAIVDELKRPIHAKDHDVAMSISMGVAIADAHVREPDLLVTRADIALYRAKTDGRNKWRLYEPHMDAELEARRQLEQLVRNATSKELFKLDFQPVYDIGGAKLLGFEALLRMQGSDGEQIPPAEFIPVAEDMGLISKIGGWVINHACEVATNWPDSLIIAVNLSPAQFIDENITDVVRSALAKTGLAPNRLELEITEGLLLHDTESVLRQLRELKEIGAAVVMDDFGTGYSSLSYLWKFPFDKLKIDRSFTMAIGEAQDSNINDILRTIVSLGHTMNMVVTAEGVERADQLATLQQLSCDQLQGFHLSRPVPESEVARIILAQVTERAAGALAEQRGPQEAASA